MHRLCDIIDVLSEVLGLSTQELLKLSGKSATIDVPLERYEALVTRLAQFETKDQEYGELREDKRPWWRRVFGEREEK